MSFARMRAAIAPLSPRIYAHPFNQALARGSLPRPSFRFFLQQDALYLADFAKALRITAARFNDAHYTRQFNKLAFDALDTQRKLHFNYLSRRGTEHFFQPRLFSVNKIPAVTHYTDHLFHTVQQGSLEEAVACLAPCYWIYNDLGRTMAQSQANPDHPYHTWIASYSSPEFTRSTQFMIQTVETLDKAVKCPRRREQMIAAFVRSSECEVGFWDSVIPSLQPSRRLHP